MIISHRHRYLFVETPHTGTTAIAHELVAHYSGESILRKHSSYSEFLRGASADERRYFTFAGIRHPMDLMVSIYFRIAKDHNQRYSQPRPTRRNNPQYRAEIEQYRWIRDSGAGFAAWFLNCVWLPYDDWLTADHGRFSGLIRFEHLQDDFAEILHKLEIDQIRPLPVVNPTAFRERDFRNYYTPETRARAAYFFGPYMERWGYDFPAEWGGMAVPRRARIMFGVLRPVRAFSRAHRTG
ncbi:MAG: sulfotransferase family 2 domain-containing protein, partial [bacterium]